MATASNLSFVVRRGTAWSQRGGAGALASVGWAENRGFRGVFEDDGGKWLKMAIFLAITEAKSMNGRLAFMD